MPDENVKQLLKGAWRKSRMTASDRWKQLKLTCKDEANKRAAKRGVTGQAGNQAKALRQCPASIVFVFVYPRLDINVSTHRNHLLKSPWCVHPKTGRLCVPLDPSMTDQFDPHCVPTLVSLFNEIESYNDAEKAKKTATGERVGEGSAEKRRKVNEVAKTSMKHYIEYFEESFLRPLLQHHAEARGTVAAQSMQSP